MFKQSNNSLTNIVDVHSHILNNVDDGSTSIEGSIRMIEYEYNEGVRDIILTPHYRIGMFENEEKDIIYSYNKLCKEVSKVLPDIRLHLGCELHSFLNISNAIKNRHQFCIAGSNYVLIEFSIHDDSVYVQNQLYELLYNGYQPIVAHVEREYCFLNDINFVKYLSSLGILFQVNADCIIGRYGKSIQKFCNELIKNDLIYCIGSDAHDMTCRKSYIGECANYLIKYISKEYAEKIMVNNPKNLIM